MKTASRTPSAPGVIGKPWRNRTAPLIVAFLIGAALSASVTFWVTRGPSFPREFKVVGTVQGFSGDNRAFAFAPDNGQPTGYAIFDTEGQSNLKVGAHVQLTVVEVPGTQAVISVAPAGSGG